MNIANSPLGPTPICLIVTLTVYDAFFKKFKCVYWKKTYVTVAIGCLRLTQVAILEIILIGRLSSTHKY